MSDRNLSEIWGQLQSLSRVVTSDYASLAVSSAAVDLSNATPALPANAIGALITVEGDQVRFRSDGTAPTSAEGHLLNVDDVLSFVGANFQEVLETIQFIRVTGDATLRITYFKDSEVG
jgi:hypothetical protein